MGFFTIIRSIEALLYEIMTWLVFYPRTLLSVLLHPNRMIDYSDTEQGDSDEDQYTDTLSPPLFLMLSILIAHGVELAAGQSASNAPRGSLQALLNSNEETLLLARAVMFSLYPLTFAVALIKRQDVALDRKTLRPPFYSQCYLGGLFALILSLAGTAMASSQFNLNVAGLAAGAVAIIWFIAVQTMWLRDHLPISRLHGTFVAIATFAKATFYNAVIGIILIM